MRAVGQVLLSFSLVVALGACRSVHPGPLTVLAKGPNSDYLWLTRDMVVKRGLFSKDHVAVVYYCERTSDFPQCHAAEYHHSSGAHAYWPTGVPCPDDEDCGVRVPPRKARPLPVVRDQRLKQPAWTGH